MTQSYFRFPVCFWDAMQNMTQQEKAAFCDAIFDYVFDDILCTPPKSVEGYFILVRPYLDSEKKRIMKG